VGAAEQVAVFGGVVLACLGLVVVGDHTHGGHVFVDLHVLD